MNNYMLEIKNLKVFYNTEEKEFQAVKGVSFNVKKGETLGIIGESGSGKTSIAMAITGILNSASRVEGKIIYEGTDLEGLTDKERNKYNWNKISLVFQNKLDVLNPVLSIREQIVEVLLKDKKVKKKGLYNKIKNLMNIVGLDEMWLYKYPHELSGGMRQKVLIAMALACNPELLIVDEPTSSLDAKSRFEIINLLKTLQKNKKFSMIVISHDISLIRELTFNTLVLYSGHIMEEGITKEVIKNPLHPYTRGLVNSSPAINPYQDLWGIPSSIKADKGKGCPFYQRCSQSSPQCLKNIPSLKNISLERKVACNRGGIVTLLDARAIDKTYGHRENKIHACKSCSIDVKSGEIVSLVGQSGSGKTTLGNILAGFTKAESGKVLFGGKEIKDYEAIRRKNGIQIVFQDPFSSTNDNFSVERVVKEPLDILNIGSKDERKSIVIKALEDVQLPNDDSFLSKKCSKLSGGQRQRIALARSLVMEPKVLIADEICSMLDPSTKANILRLLKGLQNKKGFSMLYITHDLNIARKIADKVFVMYEGEIIESGTALDIFNSPKCSYTKSLLQEGLYQRVY